MNDGGKRVILRVELGDLADHFNPFDGEGWGCPPVDPDEVLASASEGLVEAEDWNSVNRRHRGVDFDDRRFHVRRIAYLFLYLDPRPAEVELADEYGRMTLFLNDGNHRFAAAVLRGDAQFAIEVDPADLEGVLAILPAAEVVIGPEAEIFEPIAPLPR
jgi:hypothetical protein